MHRSGENHTSRERIEQVLNENDKTVRGFKNYIPIEGANIILKKWAEAGHEIIYISSHRNRNDVKADAYVLKKFGFPKGKILYRHKNISYKSVIKKEKPEIIIEDNCESIEKWITKKVGFLPRFLIRRLCRREMVCYHIPKAMKKEIKSIIVEEFKGIADVSLNYRR